MFPTFVKGIDGSNNSTSAHSMSAGTSHACAIMKDGQVKCWGAQSRGQLGTNQTEGEVGTRFQFLEIYSRPHQVAEPLASP